MLYKIICKQKSEKGDHRSMPKQNQFVKDMTRGTPWKLLLQFAVPLFIGNIFQQLYNMVDSIVVGNFVSSHALGAIGATNSCSFSFSRWWEDYP